MPSASTGKDVVVYRVRGPSVVQDADVKRFDSEVRGLVDGKSAKLAIDFSGVHHVTSRVLGIMVAIHDKLGKLGGGVVLFGVNPATERVLKVTRLHTILPVVTNEQAA